MQDMTEEDPRPPQDDGGGAKPWEDPAAEDEARRAGPTAAYAINWKTVIAIDAAMGLVVVAAGFVAMVVWNLLLGAALSALGLFYVAMVLRRGRAWQQLRREAGL